VADHHDFVERGIEPVGVELLVNALQSLPQIGGGEQDGIVRVVGEEPELDPLAELRIVLELVDDIRPAGGARDRAVDEHDGHAARPVGMHHQQPLGEEWLEGREKAADLGVPDG